MVVFVLYVFVLVFGGDCYSHIAFMDFTTNTLLLTDGDLFLYALFRFFLCFLNAQWYNCHTPRVWKESTTVIRVFPFTCKYRSRCITNKQNLIHFFGCSVLYNF